MKFFLSSGGTGGHIFPAEALAEELKNRGHEIIFITDERYKNYDGAPKSFSVMKIPAATLQGGLPAKLKSVLKILQGIIVALKILNKAKGAVMVGFGGYPSFPTIVAAKILGLKIIIHEQNSVLGITNRALSRFADKIATSFSEVWGISEENQHKISYTGNPVRKQIADLQNLPYPEINGFNIVVVGGSLGASIFSDIVPAAIKKLSPSMQNKIHIFQQARRNDAEKVKAAYAEIPVQAEVQEFFTNIAELYANAHLIIARSGASTVAELALIGKPAIFVPYPNSKGDHQLLNAEALAEIGGAWVMDQKDFRADNLAKKLQEFYANPAMLKTAAEKIMHRAKPGAVQNLANLAEELAQSKM